MRTLEPGELEAIAERYDEHGFAYARGVFDEADLAPLNAALDAGGASPGGFSVTDSQGGQQELSVWMHLGDDLIGVMPRLASMAAIAEAVIGETVAHWHSKLSWKRPGTTSLWDWHQDYGFWFAEGVARPDMCTIAIALGPVTEVNGCMQLISGSHRLGRLDVVPVGESQASDPEAVAEALVDSPVELCELAAGDVVVFHSNTLHSSGPNQSNLPRTMLMSSYNAVSNAPADPATGRVGTALDVVPDSALESGWQAVFGPSAFVDPLETGTDQGYSIAIHANQETTR